MLYLTGERIIVSPQLNRVSLVIGKMDVHDELAAPVAKSDMFAVVHVRFLLLYARPRKSLRI